MKHRSKNSPFPCASLACLAIWFATATQFAVAATSLQLGFTVPSSLNESNRQAVLEWNAEPAKTYLVQSAGDLLPGTLWKTEAPVRATKVGPLKWMAPEVLSERKYFRLVLPQPELFTVEPAFIDSSDPTALLYVTGQCLPTNGTVVINGLSYTPTMVDSNGSWAAISLNGLPPGTPIIGNLLVLDNASNVVATLPLQSSVFYGTEMPAEQLQGPPEEPPASPAFLSKRGYDYYKAKSDLSAAGLQSNPYFQENNNAGEMPHGRLSPGAIAGIAVGSVVDNARAGHLVEVLEIVGHQINYALWGGGGGGGGSGGKKGINAVNVKLARTTAPGSATAAGISGGVVAGIVVAAPGSGELQSEETDLAVSGRGLDFAWTRTYRSRTGPTTAQGAGWDFSYNVSLAPQPDGTMVLRPGNGRADTFYPNATNGWSRDEYFVEIRDLNSDTIPDVPFPDGGQWLFHVVNGDGSVLRLWKIVDRNGNTITLEYNVAGQLTAIVDTLDRTNSVAHNVLGQIESVTDFSGRTVRYEYDGQGDLTACVSPPVIGTPNGNDFPGGKTNRYTYSSGLADDRLNHNLTACMDPLGQTWLQISYQATNNPASLDFDAVDFVLRGADKQNIRRGMVIAKPGRLAPGLQAIVNDGVGNVTECFYDSRFRLVELREFTGRANPKLPTTATENRPKGKLRPEDADFFETRFEWNPDSLCTRILYPRGDATEMVYEREFNQNASRTNRRHAADLRILREVACCDQDDDGDGIVDALTTTFEYDPRFGSRGFRDDRQKVLNGEVLRFASGPRQTTSQDGSFELLGRFGRPAINTASRREKLKGTTGNPHGDFNLGTHLSAEFAISVTDPRGIVTEASYDTQGNRVKVKFPWLPGAEADFTCDSFGQCTAITNAPDANGRRSVDTFAYSQGQIVQCVADAAAGGFNLTTAFERDARGNVTRCVDPRGNDSLYTCNALDELVRYESPTNLTARCATDFYFDANGNLAECRTEVRNESDVQLPPKGTLYQYDRLNRCTELVQQVSPGQFITNRFFYDSNDRLVAAHSPAAVAGLDPLNTVGWQYDERGLLYRCVRAPGSPSQSTDQCDYDLNGNKVYLLAGLESPAGASVRRFGYDGLSRCVSVTDPMSNVVTCAYDRNDNLVYQRIDAEPNDVPGSTGNLRYHEWRWKYNALDECVEARAAFFDPATQTPIGDGLSVSACAYAPNGDCLSVTDDNGHTTRYTYDTVGRLASITDPKSNVVSYTYDECDNVLSVTQTDRSDLTAGVQQFIVVHAYDKLHRLTRSVDNVGNTTSYAYDSLGRVVRAVDPRGAITRCEYDLLSRKTKTFQDMNDNDIVEDADVVTTQTWDDNSRIVSRTDDNTNTTFYAYDSRDRLIETTKADGTHSSLVWSPRSNLLREQDANGTIISNRFDELDRCVRRDITPGPGVAATTTFETFAYDGLSRLVAATNDVSNNEFAYDSLGNPTRGVSGGLGAVVSSFDGVGNRLSLTYPVGRLVTYTYNALDQVTSVSSGSEGLPPTTLATFDYEGPGRLGRINRANNVNTRIQWNGLVNPPNAGGDFGWGQVRGINHQVAGGGAVIDRRVFTYDQKQNKTLRAQTAPFFGNGPMTTNVFEYDPLDRLSRAINTKGTGSNFRAYTLDGNGNRQLVVSNGVAEVYSMAATIPPGDFQMNQYTFTPLVLAPEQYDENGNLVGRLTATAQLQYVYDYADRLVAVGDLATGSFVPVANYTYDALGRRVSKTTYPLGLPPTTAQFLYDDGDILEVYEAGALAVSCVSSLSGSGGGAAAASYAATGRLSPPIATFNPAGAVTYLHTDDLGNVLALTDASGKVIERYDYDDFGAPQFLTSDGIPTPASSSAFGNSFLFRGMEWDAETGLYRQATGGYVDPQTGRSTSSINGINGGMPNRISMNVTVPKQTQGTTFGEKANAGLVGTSTFHLTDNNPWSREIASGRIIAIATSRDRVGGWGGGDDNGFENRRATAIGRLCRGDACGDPETQMLRAMFGLTGTAVTNGAIGRRSLIGRCVPRNLQGMRL